MNQNTDILHEAKRLRLLAAALELQHFTCTASNIVPIPGGDRVIAIGTPAQIAKLLPEVFAQARAQQESAAPADQKHLPGWERGIATVTMTGHQLREALDFINPGGGDEPEERDDELTFGIVQVKDDTGHVSSGLCWNDDSDGVLPLDASPEGAAICQPHAATCQPDGAMRQPPAPMCHAPAQMDRDAMLTTHEGRLALIRDVGGPAMVHAVNNGKISIQAAATSCAASPAAAPVAAHAQQDAAPAEPDGFVAAVGAWVSARDYWQDDEHECVKRTWADLLRFAASAPSDATGKAEDLAGRVVSVDVSTGDDDYANRIFAKLTGETGSDGTTLLAIETERNFGATGEAVAANAGVDYEEIADMVDSLVITNQRKYMKGNVAYELDQFAARIRKMASQAPAATSAADAKDADRDMGEPTMLWDADDPEDGTHGDSPQDFAENYACNSGMTGEILVDVLCAYRGGKRTMRITVADDCTVSWSWANRCAAIAATQQAAPGNKTQSAPAEKAAVQETAKPILWAALNLNGQIVYLNANRENVEYNRRFIKTPTRIVGLVVQERATAVGADAQAQSSEQQAEKGEPNVG